MDRPNGVEAGCVAIGGGMLDLQCEAGNVCLAQTPVPKGSNMDEVAAHAPAIRLVDTEYAGINSVAYDIANHWCTPVFAGHVLSGGAGAPVSRLMTGHAACSVVQDFLIF